MDPRRHIRFAAMVEEARHAEARAAGRCDIATAGGRSIGLRVQRDDGAWIE
ncbi:MAG: hypothetical protein ABW048_05030 [Sphingobium sp.]